MERLGSIPSVYYQPGFISKEEEERLIHSVNSAPKPKWQQLTHRRLQNWGGIPHPKGMIAEQIPDWLMQYVNKVGELELFGGKRPNHVLVNEYLPGQGIMPHTDGPLFHPVISTISLGSHTVLNFYEMPDTAEVCEDTMMPANRKKVMSVLVEPRSLLIVRDDLYSCHMHSIDEIKTDTITEDIANPGSHGVGNVLNRKTRISLTIRHVPKTTKAKILIGR